MKTPLQGGVSIKQPVVVLAVLVARWSCVWLIPDIRWMDGGSTLCGIILKSEQRVDLASY